MMVGMGKRRIRRSALLPDDLRLWAALEVVYVALAVAAAVRDVALGVALALLVAGTAWNAFLWWNVRRR